MLIWSPVLMPDCPRVLDRRLRAEGWGESVKLSADLVGLVTPTDLNPLAGRPAHLRDVRAGKRCGRRRCARWRKARAVSATSTPCSWAMSRWRWRCWARGWARRSCGRGSGARSSSACWPGPAAADQRPLPVQPGQPAARRRHLPAALRPAALHPFHQRQPRAESQQRDPDAGAGGAGGVWRGVAVGERISESANQRISECKRAITHASRVTHHVSTSPLVYLSTCLLAVLILVEHLAVPLPTTDAAIPAVYQQIAAGAGRVRDHAVAAGLAQQLRRAGQRADASSNTSRPPTASRCIGGNISRAPAFKMDYFARIPLFQALTDLEMYGSSRPRPMRPRASRRAT